MIFLVTFLLILSLILNGILVWYSRNLIKKLWDCMYGVDEFQKYIEAYCTNLTSVFELSDFYGDQTIKATIDDTKLVIENCKVFKKSIMGEDVDEKLKDETEQ